MRVTVFTTTYQMCSVANGLTGNSSLHYLVILTPGGSNGQLLVKMNQGASNGWTMVKMVSDASNKPMKFPKSNWVMAGFNFSKIVFEQMEFWDSIPLFRHYQTFTPHKTKIHQSWLLQFFRIYSSKIINDADNNPMQFLILELSHGGF